jgi:cation:H+ antiporter
MGVPASVGTDLATVAASTAVLWACANLVVSSSVRIARRLGVSDLVVGLTVVAIGTSAPEFAVTVDAALGGRPDIAVGNVVGSNLFNLGVILGGVAVVGRVPATRKLVRRDGVVLVGAVVFALLVLSDLRIGRLEGGLMMAALAAYLLALFRAGDPLERTVTDRGGFRRTDVVRLVVGIAGILLGANLLVNSASDLALLVGLSEWTVGATVVAAGTSTPELATAIVAARRGEFGLSAGNLVGSDLFNVLGVLGAAAVVRPMTVDGAAVPGLLAVLLLVVVAVGLLRTGYRLDRWEGAVLVAIALARWAMDVLAGPG